MKHGGHIARTAGLVIMTSIATAAISHSVLDPMTQGYLTFLTIAIGAFLAAVASDYDGK